MFHTWTPVLASLLLLSLLVHVQAGHPAWETSRAQHPEWLALDMEPPRGYALWPNKKIRYAFANDEASHYLRHITRRAHELWLAAGLPEDFKIEEVPIAECDRTRDTCLRIERRNSLSTPVGVIRVPLQPGVPPPSAYWTENDKIGLLEAVPNIAHELGHAWGLFHEMQSKLYWYNPGSFFEYRCERVAGFEHITQQHQLTHEQIWDKDNGLCTNALVAESYGFPGGLWQPYPVFRMQYSEHNTYPSIHDVDWDSIMWYPSYMGFPGQSQDDHDFSKAVILKGKDILPEDRWIGRNFDPSPMDIEGLKILYGHRWPVPAPVLYGRSDSPNNPAFKRMAPGCGR